MHVHCMRHVDDLHRDGPLGSPNGSIIQCRRPSSPARHASASMARLRITAAVDRATRDLPPPASAIGRIRRRGSLPHREIGTARTDNAGLRARWRTWSGAADQLSGPAAERAPKVTRVGFAVASPPGRRKSTSAGRPISDAPVRPVPVDLPRARTLAARRAAVRVPPIREADR
jgi:hypothetical protein